MNQVRDRAVYQEDSSSSSSSYDEGNMYSVSTNNVYSRNTPKVNVNIRGRQANFTVDSGARKTVIDQSTYQHLGRPKLSPTDVKLYPYGSSTPIDLIGKFMTIIQVNSTQRWTQETVYVIKMQHCGCILSKSASQRLHLIKLSPVLNRLQPATTLSRRHQEQPTSSTLEEGPRITDVNKAKSVNRRMHPSFRNSTYRAEQVSITKQQHQLINRQPGWPKVQQPSTATVIKPVAVYPINNINFKKGKERETTGVKQQHEAIVKPPSRSRVRNRRRCY